MTRAEFIRAYAKRSKLAEPRYADIGRLDLDGCTMIALPCGCGEERCDGWAMLMVGSVLHHLFFHLPEPARRAYQEALHNAEGLTPAPAPGGTE